MGRKSAWLVLADTDCLTAHGRPVENIVPFIQPGARLVDPDDWGGHASADRKAFEDRGYQASRMTVFAALGGPTNSVLTGSRKVGAHDGSSVQYIGSRMCRWPETQVTSRLAGLPDHLFQHDGKMTKPEVRAVTLAKLMPMRGALLVGYWLRLGLGCHRMDARRTRCAWRSALSLAPIGAPWLPQMPWRLVRRAYSCLTQLHLTGLADLPDPDARVLWRWVVNRQPSNWLGAELKPLGRLVANAVTLESESILLQLFAKMGGDLTRIAIQRADPVGHLTGWRPMMPVTQWSMVKR